MSAPSWLVNDYLGSGACLERPSNAGTAAGSLPAAAAESTTARRRLPVAPRLSVIVNNYNGAPWLERCLASLRAQTIWRELEVIVADNASPDGSALLAAKLMRDWPNGRVLEHATDLEYCEGNNQAAETARGHYLLFLNNDTWLEPDCLEELLREVANTGATAAAPLVQDYADGRVQTAGEAGFDVFGFMSHNADWARTRTVFVAAGCALLVEADRFRQAGGFDRRMVSCADEFDLCWRIWLTGGKVILVTTAKVHHRGAAGVNPLGGGQWQENRTSDSKRFLATRNNMLVLLKNCQHVLLLLVPVQIMLLAAEAVFMAALTRRWSHVRRAYVEALRDCWRLRHHVLSERRRLATLRQRGDFWMLRFLRARLNRWGELRRMARFGLLRVDAK